MMKSRSEIPVETHVPLPTREHRHHNAKYPFGEMDVGDSFVIPEGSELSCKYAAYAYGRRWGKTFAVRKQDDGRVRLWRTT